MAPASQAVNHSGSSTTPNDSQQQEEQDSANIAVEFKRAQQLFELRECPTHQAGGMCRIHRIAEEQVEQDRSGQKRYGRTQNA